jgi:hypothetical protein
MLSSRKCLGFRRFAPYSIVKDQILIEKMFLAPHQSRYYKGFRALCQELGTKKNVENYSTSTCYVTSVRFYFFLLCFAINKYLSLQQFLQAFDFLLVLKQFTPPLKHDNILSL